MGCFWSKEDEEPRYNSSVRREVQEQIYFSRPIPTPRVTRDSTWPQSSYVSNQNQLVNRIGTQNRFVEPRVQPKHIKTTEDVKFKPSQDHEKSKFGEYKCKNCNRYWASRLCWPGNYQICKTCRKPVYPFTYREVKPSDMSDENNKEHLKELCQKCKSLGYYCNDLNKKYKHQLPTRSKSQGGKYKIA